MGQVTIRDFIYLDVERVRSFVAQISGGLTSQLTTETGHEVGVEGSIEGAVPFVAKAEGNLDYRYLKSQSETKSLHDYMFEDFWGKLTSRENLIDVANINQPGWQEDSFKDGAFVLVKGMVKIIDYQSLTLSIQALPRLADTIARVTSASQGTNPQKNVADLQKTRSQYKNLPIKELSSLLQQFFGELVRVKVFPFRDDPSKVFVGTAERAFFRYSPAALTNLYGPVVDADWVCIIQVNKGALHTPGSLISDTGNQIEDSIEQLADSLSALGTLTQGVKFPAVAVTPIAMYREVQV